MLNKDRKFNRLPGFDYSLDGFYFVTVCCQNKINYFGKIDDEKMILNRFGEIVKRQWQWLAKQYLYVKLDEFIIMPNHVHGIIFINNVGTGRDLSLPRPIKSLSELIGAFKTTSSKLIHQSGLIEFQWQRSFYDHIIRNEKSLNNIRQYIIDNPKKWQRDRNNQYE